MYVLYIYVYIDIYWLWLMFVDIIWQASYGIFSAEADVYGCWSWLAKGAVGSLEGVKRVEGVHRCSALKGIEQSRALRASLASRYIYMIICDTYMII